MNILSNPLQSPLFFPVLERTVLILLIGAFAITILSHNSSKKFQHELWNRYRSWAVMAPVFILSIFVGGIAGLSLISFLMFRAIKEYANMANLPKIFTKTLLFFIPISLFLCFTKPDLVTYLPLIYGAALVVTGIKFNKSDGVEAVSISLFGSIWIIMLLLYSPILMASGQTLAVIVTGFAVALADIGSFSAGKILPLFKAEKLFPVASNISPNKTLLGYLGGLIGSSVAVFLFLPFYQNSNILILFGFAITLAIAAAVGDLTESMVKRYFKTKDSSNIIPGHGGVLDRIDSYLPAIFITSLWISIF